MDGESVLIIGANASSEALIKQLLKLNFSVTLIDSDAGVLQYFDEKYDLACITGHPSHADVLTLALETNPEYLVAATTCDETNILVCQAISNHNIHTICCIHNSKFLDQNKHIPNIEIDRIVLMNKSVIDEYRLLTQFPEFFHINHVSPEHIAISINLNQHPFVGHTLNEMQPILPQGSILAGLYRNNAWVEYRKNIKLTDTDHILVIAKSDQLSSFAQSNINLNFTILGISAITESFCELNTKELNTTVIDSNLDKCQSLSEHYSDVTVIHHSPQDLNFIQPYVNKNQIILSLSQDDENNLIYAFGAIDAGAQYTFNLVNHIKDGHIFASSPIQHIINKPQIVCDHIFRDILTKKSVNHFYTKPNFMQMASIHIAQDHSFIGKSVHDLDLEENVIVGCIIRDEKLLFTSKKQVIERYDELVIYAPHALDQTNPLEITITQQI
jgi:trk system potassium uptake protein TrkA